jgi:RNA polymerase sigma-70 factor, ECF subfamily
VTGAGTAPAGAMGAGVQGDGAGRRRPRVLASAARTLRRSAERPERAAASAGAEVERAAAGGVGLDEVGVRARVGRARAGDTDALGELFQALEGDVARLCARLSRTREDAEDAASEAFLRAQRGLGGYDERQPFRRWLLAIAAHGAIDRLRRRGAEQRLFAPAPADAERLPEPGPSPLQHELDEERRGQVLAAIEALPERYRAPLVLRYYAELDYEAIAGLLELSRSQVAMLLFRARRRLRERLGELR